MDIVLLNLMLVILGAMSFAQATASDSTRTLPNYNGALTNITCTTTAPFFVINGVYSSIHYNQLPELFGIEAEVANDRSSVTLQINGTILAHNVTIECQNIVDPVLGQTERVFQLTLLFADTIPAPHRVEYDDENGLLSWSPPLLEDTETMIMGNNTKFIVAPRISHYIIYVTDLQTGLITNFTTTGQDTNIFNIMPAMPCSISVQVSAVNLAGEGQRSSSITAHRCKPDVVTGSKDSTIQDNVLTENESSAENLALSYGGIVAVAITVLFVVILVACITLVTVCIFTKYRKKYKDSKPRKSMVINEESPDSEISKPRLSEETPEVSESSQTELLTPSSSPIIIVKKQPAMTQHQLQYKCLQNGQEKSDSSQKKTAAQLTQDGQLIYAELAAPVVNPVSQPSSVENTAYAVINHTNLTN